MPISNLSNGLRTGVCTFANRPTTPYEGQVIYETDTDLSYIWNGSSWQQVSGGTAVGNSGLVYVNSATVGTGVTTTQVVNCFSSTYDNYRIIWSGGTISALALIGVYMGTATASAYYGTRLSATIAGVANSTGDNNSGQWVYACAGTTTTSPMCFDLFQPFSTTRTHIDSVYFEVNGASSVFGKYTGVLDNATSYTGFTIDPQGATTMTGGTITVYGYRKA